jgi:hypothetical protein
MKVLEGDILCLLFKANVRNVKNGCLMKRMEQVTGAAGELQCIRMSGVYILQDLTISRATSNTSFPFRPVPPYSVS